MAPLKRVYSVLYHDEKSAGPAGDGSHIMRFGNRAQADEFAKGKVIYGKPASVEVDDVPRHLAQRWGVY